MLASERASIARLDKRQLARALRQLGEDVPPDADRGALLQRLAARRLAERARVVRLPLRLTFAGRRSSRRYLTVPVDVGDVGFVDFLLEAGSYQCLISSELRERLGLGPGDGAAVRAVDSSGPTLRQRVELPDMWLGTFKLPRLSACVSELPVARAARRQQQQRQQEQQPPPPEQQQPQQPAGPGGMLGVRALLCFDIDIDWAGNRLVFHPAGHAAAGLLDTQGLKAVPCQFTKSGLVIMSVSINSSPPILGILDLSAGVTILNWEAAELLGMQCQAELERQDVESGGSSSSESKVGGGSTGTGTGGGSSAGGSRGPKHGAGCFGSIRVRPLEQLLLDRPASGVALPQHGQQQQHHEPQRRNGAVPHASSSGGNSGGRDSSSSSSSSSSNSSSGGAPLPPQPPQIRLPSTAEQGPTNVSSWQPLPGPSGQQGPNGSPAAPTPQRPQQQQQQQSSQQQQQRSSGAAAGSSGSRPTGGPPGLQSLVQVHELFEHEVEIVLGAGGKSGGVKVAPPPKLAVAHLKGLAQVGLAGRPAVVVGGDIWGKERMVLCMKARVMYL